MLIQLSLFTFFPSPLRNDYPEHFVLWNVGQGQWATYAIGSACLHFDMGGEKAPWRAILELCRHRENRLYLSHLDWDHIRWIRSAQRRLKNLCLWKTPQAAGFVKPPHWLLQVPLCPDHPTRTLVTELNGISGRKGDRNSGSRVFILNDRILLPGDSPAREEARWSSRYRHLLKNVEILIAGHHGSRTSTSRVLLEKLPRLKLTLVSARRRKYGHPHPVVLGRLRRSRSAVITTENWGSIHFPVYGRYSIPRSRATGS